MKKAFYLICVSLLLMQLPVTGQNLVKLSEMDVSKAAQIYGTPVSGKSVSGEALKVGGAG